MKESMERDWTTRPRGKITDKMQKQKEMESNV